MTTELMIIEPASVEVLAFVQNTVDDTLDRIEQEFRSIVTDISTPKGRKEIASLALKVAKTKTSFDAAGEELKSGYKVKVDAIDAERRKIRTRLDALKEEIRKPLTEWEEAEERRVADHEGMLNVLAVPREMPVSDMTPEEIDSVLLVVQSQHEKRDWQEFQVRANMEISMTNDFLTNAKVRRTKEIADAEELARLRKAEEDRLQKERDDKIAADAAEVARLEAEAVAKKAADEAEALRLKQVAATERAEQEAKDEKARADAAEEKAAADKIAAEEDAKRREKAAAQKILDDQAEEKRLADIEQEKRNKNLAHKKKINNEAMAALLKVLNESDDIEDAAKAVVIAIASGKIPHVKITY